MAPLIYLDTHILVWLFVDGDATRLSREAIGTLRTAQEVRFSPATRLELQFLFEIGRLLVSPEIVMDELGSRMGLVECPTPFTAVAKAASAVGWTRDPFDRLIVGQAGLNGSKLATRDRTIRDRFNLAVW